MKLAIAVTLLAGCQLVFPAESTCAVGHDEDRDDIDDGCDNCPTVDNSDQLDMFDGGDSVGDACDPNKNAAGDRIVYFESFANPGDRARWDDLARRWQVGDDTLVVTGPATRQQVFDGVDTLPAPPYLVEVHLTVTDFDDNASDDVGVVVDAGADGNGVRCAIRHVEPEHVDLVHVSDDTVLGLAADGDEPLMLVRPEGYRLQLDYQGTSARCLVIPDTGEPSRSASLPVLAGRQPGKLGFEATNMDAIVDYVVIYGH